MLAHVEPSHPWMGALLHNLSRLSRTGVVLNLSNQRLVTKKGEPVYQTQDVTKRGRLVRGVYPVVGMSDLWEVRYANVPPPKLKKKPKAPSAAELRQMQMNERMGLASLSKKGKGGRSPKGRRSKSPRRR
eukprot:6230820-Prymnesium_polylepis.1